MQPSSSEIKVYEGKAKILRILGDTAEMEFKDSLTAFNGKKVSYFDGKGAINAEISYILFEYLEKHGIKTHLIDKKDPKTLIVKYLKMIPLEVVVRNYVAGSLQRRLGLEEKRRLPNPIVEFYYKNDELGDPLINRYHAKILGVSEEIIDEIESLALKINDILVRFFENIETIIADFKLEFGVDKDGKIVLGDEISPDTCRFWDVKTLRSLDKDVFRYDLGDVREAYIEILRRVKNGKIQGESICTP